MTVLIKPSVFLPISISKSYRLLSQSEKTIYQSKKHINWNLADADNNICLLGDQNDKTIRRPVAAILNEFRMQLISKFNIEIILSCNES